MAHAAIPARRRASAISGTGSASDSLREGLLAHNAQGRSALRDYDVDRQQLIEAAENTEDGGRGYSSAEQSFAWDDRQECELSHNRRERSIAASAGRFVAQKAGFTSSRPLKKGLARRLAV